MHTTTVTPIQPAMTAQQASADRRARKAALGSFVGAVVELPQRWYSTPSFFPASIHKLAH